MPGARRRPVRTALRITLPPAPAGERPDAGVLAGVLALAAHADRSGLDGVFLARVPGSDPYPILGALASMTSGTVLGCLAAPAGERPPAVLAKVVSSLDVLSGGRAVLGLGPGSRRAALADGLLADGLLADGLLADGLLADGLLADDLAVCRAMLRTPPPMLAPPARLPVPPPALSDGPDGESTAHGIALAWNEPRVDTAGPLPIALVVPASPPRGHPDAGRPGAGARYISMRIAVAARFAEWFVAEVGSAGPAWSSRPVPDGERFDAGSRRVELDAASCHVGRAADAVALLVACDLRPEASPGEWTPDEVLARAAAWRAAGCDGVLVDVGPGDLVAEHPERLEELVARLGAESGATRA